MMDLFIPYGFTPYEGATNFGVFGTREKAQAVLDVRKPEGAYEQYDIYVTKLDEEDTF